METTKNEGVKRKAGTSGKSDVMLKPRTYQERLGNVTALFRQSGQGIDQGSILVLNTRVTEQGKRVDSPIVTAYLTPQQVHADEKAVYSIQTPRLDRQNEVTQLGYYHSGKLTFVTAAGACNALKGDRRVLNGMLKGMGEIRNTRTNQPSRHVFFAGDIGEGKDIESFAYNHETGAWIDLTSRGQTGIVVMDILKGVNKDDPEMLIGYRTDASGRPTAIICAKMTEIASRPQMLTLPNAQLWHTIAEMPPVVGNIPWAFAWTGRIKRDPKNPTVRIGMMGLDATHVVPFSFSQETYVGNYGSVIETPYIPASVFQIDATHRGFVLTSLEGDNVNLAIGYGNELPPPYHNYEQLQSGS